MIRLATILLAFSISACVAMQGVYADEPLGTSTIQMPELAACSCESAYRCMSDQDYMQLVAVFKQEPDRFIKCEACP